MIKRLITLVIELDITEEQSSKWPHSFYALDSMSEAALRAIHSNRVKIILKRDEPRD